MGWLDDLTSPDIFGESTPEVGSSGWDIFGQSSPEVGSAEWLTQELSNLPATDTSGITGTIGDDWLSPVGSETGDYFTDSDIFGGDWLGGGDVGDDWIGDWFSSLSDPEVGSADWATQGLSDLDYEGSILDSILNPDYYTDDDIQNYFTSGDIFGTSFLDDLLSGDLPEATYGADPVVGDPANVAAGGDPADPAAELTWWQKLLQGVIGSGSGPFGGSVLGPQGEGTTQGLLGGILSTLFGGGGGGGIFGGGGGAEGEGGGLGGLFGSNPLMAFLMAKSLMKDDKSSGDIIPIGQQAYGAPEAYNMPDYRVTNLEPALMPGVGYANMAQPQQPIGMEQGGLAGLGRSEILRKILEKRAEHKDFYSRTEPERNQQWVSVEEYEKLKRKGRIDRKFLRTKSRQRWNPVSERMEILIPGGFEGEIITGIGGLPQLQTGGVASEGPGDITLAKLEPGEFVMTRKATQNIGAKNLYDLMKRAEGRGG